MRFLMTIAIALTMFATGATAATTFKSKYSSIERVKGSYTYTEKSGELKAVIDLSEQRIHITRTGKRKMSWTISSGAKGYETPPGSYRPTRIFDRYFSKTYDDAPMHWAVFFHGGYALHQSGTLMGMGTPQSHGCIRLSPFNAARFL